MATDEPPQELSRMSPEEIFGFAEAFLAGDIYSNANVPQHLWLMVFMPVALGAKAPLETGLLYANAKTDKTMGRAVNGYPMFASCRFMHIDDVPLAQTAIDKLKAAKEALKKELES